MSNKLALVLTAGLLIGCGSNKDVVVPPKWQDLKGEPAAQVAKGEFGKALTLLAKHDRANDWTSAICQETADQFLVAAELMKRVDERRTEHLAARYNASLAYQRCDMTSDAKEVLGALLRDEPGYHRASAQLAMYRYDETGNVDEAISSLETSIAAGHFKNVDALVNLAALLMRRDSGAVDENGHDDRARARLNLQRALAVDDGHMPALNQLAILYLRLAGGEQSELQVASVANEASDKSHATLELAALICSQAMRKNPRYAPVHNTAGLVHARLGDLSAAAKSFARARALNPSFFEAHMNYAAVNLQFRGFENAQQAYEKALKIRPKSYDAMLGLSLALRGQVGADSEGAMLAKAERLLKRAKTLAPDRPEAWFNQAILLQEFRARGLSPTETRQVLLAAKRAFGEFLSRAAKQRALADARTRAKERMRDIDEMLKFMN